MRKLDILISLVLVLVIATGCQNRFNHQSETVTANFEFDIPDEYTISEINDHACSICQGVEAIGGIVLTNLNHGKITDINKTELRQYLDLFAPSPLTYEYVAMYCSDTFDYVSISFVITDPDTQASTYYHHYLFERAGGCYDLWLADELIDGHEQSELLASIVG